MMTPIETAIKHALTPIEVGKIPLTILMIPDGKTACAVSSSGTVTPTGTGISVAKTPGKAITAGQFPSAIAITSESVPDCTTWTGTRG